MTHLDTIVAFNAKFTQKTCRFRSKVVALISEVCLLLAFSANQLHILYIIESLLLISLLSSDSFRDLYTRSPLPLHTLVCLNEKGKYVATPSPQLPSILSPTNVGPKYRQGRVFSRTARLSASIFDVCYRQSGCCSPTPSFSATRPGVKDR